jgi:hypothetical protein
MSDQLPPVEPREDGALGTITIYPGQFLFESRDGRRGASRKFISPAALRQAVSGTGVDSGWLAPEVRRCGECAHGEWAVMYAPPARRRLVLTSEGKRSARSEVEITCALPAFVFFGLATDYYVWATRRAEFSPQAEVFRAPLPNVYPEGHICFGSNHPPRVPAALVARMFEKSVAVCTDAGKSVEALFHLWWDGERWRVEFPEQIADEWNVRPVHSGEGTSTARALIELHSHHHMAAFFSAEDDADEENGFRLYAVIGDIFSRPAIRVRVGLHGYFCEVEAAEIFELPEGVRDACRMGTPEGEER